MPKLSVRSKATPAKLYSYRTKESKAYRGIGLPLCDLPYYSLPTPNSNSQLPLFVEERAHRDTLFPANADDIKATLRTFPSSEYKGISHIWMRRRSPKETSNLMDYYHDKSNAVLVFAPWNKSLTFFVGPGRKRQALMKFAQEHDVALRGGGGNLQAKFSEESAKAFVLHVLLPWSIAHHLDARREKPSTSKKKSEDFAAQYLQRRNTPSEPGRQIQKTKLRFFTNHI